MSAPDACTTDDVHPLGKAGAVTPSKFSLTAAPATNGTAIVAKLNRDASRLRTGNLLAAMRMLGATGATLVRWMAGIGFVVITD
jgi:hypothetical protein